MSTYNLKKWREYYLEIGLRNEVAEAHIRYVTPLLQRGLPPIFDFEHLANLLGRTKHHLASIINSPKHHYRSFNIKKRSGGLRRISAPYPSLCECQRWILDNILYKIKVSENVYGFFPGRSIVSNAISHIDKDYLLKIDIKDFFRSIKLPHIIALFMSLGYNAKVSFYLSQICCLDGELPQGSPASPHLSNIIGYRMDRRIIGYLRRRGLKYTRYADDIAISGRQISNLDIWKIIKILNTEGFTVNKDKLRLIGPDGRKIVTGIDITSGHPRPTKEFRKQLKKEAYYISKFGIHSHMKKEKIRNPLYFESIVGKIHFWEHIDSKSPDLQKIKSWLELDNKSHSLDI